MYNIKIYNKISGVGLEVLDKVMYNVTGDTDEPDGAIVRSASLFEEMFPESLLCIARAGAGTNNIPISRLFGEGVVV
jgi:D-3-phosphoglycerate dehydrogenase